MYDCLLLQYGEVGLKSSRTRPYFERLYIKSIKECLKRSGFENFEIKNFGGRFVVYLNNPLEAANSLSKVPGIQGIFPAANLRSEDKKKIILWIKKLVEEQDLLKNKTFGVKVKRSGKQSFKSMNLAKEVADEIYDFSKGVDLTNPDVWIKLEARKDECFFYTHSIKGIGGLPAGISEKVLCLFSGGIDSPVAAFEMLKRGCKVDFLFVNIRTKKLFYQVAKIYNFLVNNYCFNYKPKFYHVDAKKIISLLKEEVPDSLRQIAYKIVLYKIGELVANKEKHLALVSGESLSQKSSQTLPSLMLIEKQASISMLRPLLTFDKIEISKIARDIGTMSSSEKVKE
jgi:thiamine biosynthesis protein ThiI